MNESEYHVLKRRAKEKRLLILARVEKKEFIKRCHAVNVCHGCGGDLKHVTENYREAILACIDEDCPEFTIQITK
jgi:hypothetical protein